MKFSAQSRLIVNYNFGEKKWIWIKYHLNLNLSFGSSSVTIFRCLNQEKNAEFCRKGAMKISNLIGRYSEIIENWPEISEVPIIAVSFSNIIKYCSSCVIIMYCVTRHVDLLDLMLSKCFYFSQSNRFSLIRFLYTSSMPLLQILLFFSVLLNKCMRRVLIKW